MKKRCYVAKFIAFCLFFTVLFAQQSETAVASSVRPSDVNKAGSGNALVRVSGTFEYVSKTKILKRINAIRKEACTKGYINPATGQKLKSSDYVPIKWSSNLEWIAQLRAAECTINEAHTRPNGKTCFSIKRNQMQSWAENLAWNYSGLTQGIEQWYGEKEDWVNQNSNAVTGHYTSMINPNYRYIGIGSFQRASGGWYGIAGEFSSSNSGSQGKSKLKGKATQTVEVSKNSIANAKIDAPAKIKLKKKKNLSVSCSINYAGIMGGNNSTQGTIAKGITWKSSRPSVIAVNKEGKITAKKVGKATITAKLKGGFTVKKTITVTR